MPIKSSGDVGIQNDIVAEFGGTAPHQITEYYRGGALVNDVANNAAINTSGEISIGDFYGAGNIVVINLTLASNTNNYDVYAAASSNPAYIAGASEINVTVNPGVTVGSTSTGTYAMQVPSSFNPADQVSITNNGVIVGKGGNGGTCGTNPNNDSVNGNGTTGGGGGHALYINRPVTITNNGTIAGAGGGGGGSGSADVAIGQDPKSGIQLVPYGGNGGGGGAGVNAGSGGAGGPAQPKPGFPQVRNGFAGSAGTATTGGAGGPRQVSPFTNFVSRTGKGGNGGARGAAGQTGEVPYQGPGPSGNYTMPKGNPAPGGARGRYITGNSFATWATNGTRLGGVS